MDNIKLLEYSIKNKEDFLDPSYTFVNKHDKLDSYIKRTKEIKNVLITIKMIQGKDGGVKVLGRLYNELQGLMTDLANFSEFSCFINACDSKREDVRKNNNLLKRITNLYLKNRGLNEIVPAEWVQALVDKTSSRKKGAAGEKKLISILQKRDYLETKSFKAFIKNKNSVARFSKSGDFSNKNINKKFGTSFGKKTQGKKLDLIIKKGKHMYFVEAKHMNGQGGEQNKQVLELIEIIRKRPLKNVHHLISFLDGVYFNELFGATNGKKAEQNKDIRKSLKKNKNNYFINTAGFLKLFTK